MTTTPHTGPTPALPAVVATRAPAELQALGKLLATAKHAETTATGSSRREAFRATRSLLAAARVLGFTVSELAALTGVSEGSVRNRSNRLAPMSPRRFYSLLPEHDQGVLDTLPGAERDPVQLLTEYLGAVFVADIGRLPYPH